MSKILIKVQDNTFPFESAHVVLVKDGKVLILKRSVSDTWMPGHYGLPGGKLNSGENPEQAVSRECKEETSLNVSPNDLIFLPKISKEKQHAFYYSTNFTGEPKLDFEHEDFQWVNPKEISKYKVVPDLPEIISVVFGELK